MIQPLLPAHSISFHFGMIILSHTSRWRDQSTVAKSTTTATTSPRKNGGKFTASKPARHRRPLKAANVAACSSWVAPSFNAESGATHPQNLSGECLWQGSRIWSFIALPTSVVKEMSMLTTSGIRSEWGREDGNTLNPSVEISRNGGKASINTKCGWDKSRAWYITSIWYLSDAAMSYTFLLNFEIYFWAMTSECLCISDSSRYPTVLDMGWTSNMQEGPWPAH